MKKKKTLIIAIVIMLVLVVAAAMWILNRGRSIRAAEEQAIAEEQTEEQAAEDAQKKAEEEVAEKQRLEEETIAQHVFSHRGSAGAEEHSFKAYDAAIEAGSRYIGVDVVISSDKVLYVSYEENAYDMTGYNGMYEYMSSESIDSLNTEAGNKVLKLSEVFDKYGKDITYVIELRSNSDACLLAFEQMVDDYGLSDNIIVASMHAETLEILEHKYPDMPKLFVCWNQGNFDYVLDLSYVDMISVRAETETGIFTESNCSAAHAAGKKFGGWTLNSEEEIKRAIDMGVDNYFTDDTALALSIEKDYGAQVRGGASTDADENDTSAEDESAETEDEG